MAETTVLSAAEHFESLREAVWVRFVARHRIERERFDDLYAEWWTRELERAGRGAPSQAAVPAAFIAEAVHNVLIDDTRARARGLAREAKGDLELVDLDERVAGADDVAAQAGYEALVHRVLTLVQGRLSDRELRVFVWSFLYMQGVEATAAALGLTAPRVKKDRRRIVGKVGAQAWAALTGELDLCAVYDEQSLPAVFGLLSVHVEDCPTCRAALGGVRRGALAVVGPELLAAGGHHWVDGVIARIHGLLHRGTETLTALPPSGRTAAVVAVAASAVAGGAATIVPHHHARAHHARAAAAAPARPVVRATAVAVVRTPRPTARPVAKAARHVHRAAAPVATTAPRRDPITFEQRAAPVAHPAAAKPARPAKEFGFEH